MKRRVELVVTLLLLVALLVPAAALAGSYDLAYGETPLGTSSKNKIHNVQLAADAITGWVVLPGETFSFNNVVGPRTEANGYLVAENGRGAKVRGGGVAQVATTLYLAVRKLSDISIVEKHTYGKNFTDGYVTDVNDAILTDYKAGTDFRFTNNGDAIQIDIWVDDAGVYCNISATGSSTSMSLIGYGTTYVGTATDNRRNNIELAANAITGTLLETGDLFSFNAIVGPRSKAAGYKSAINGRGVKVTGGGVAQVASTVYLAIKDLDEVTIVEKRTYGDSYNQSYVSSSADAIVTDYSAGTDFSFRNTSGDDLIIYTYIDETGWLCCEVWADSGWGGSE